MSANSKEKRSKYNNGMLRVIQGQILNFISCFAAILVMDRPTFSCECFSRITCQIHLIEIVYILSGEEVL